MTVSEDTLHGWSRGPSDTEAETCENAERIIKDALQRAGVLEKWDVDVFAQGSYRNNTNISQESDVDICARSGAVFWFDLPKDCGDRAHHGLTSPSTLRYTDFKDDVGKALEARFRPVGYSRGDKTFNVRENSYRIDAHVVPVWAYREYFSESSRSAYREGVRFYSDKNNCFTNYPQQHIANGIKKNEDTGNRFKRLVRVLKNLRYAMKDDGVTADVLPSFLVESCVFNVPNFLFGNPTYKEDLKSVIASIYGATKDDDSSKGWLEVNNVKYLFHASQPWSRQSVNDFSLKAWTYVGF